MREQTERLPDVLAVIGITQATATNWLRRGYEGAKIEGPGRGRRARRIGRSLIVRLALMKKLADLGIPPSTAATWASVALKTLEEAHFEKLHILIQDGAPETFLIDDVEAPAAPDHPIAAMTVTINIRALVDSLRARLAELAAINAEDGPPRRKRAVPARKKLEPAGRRAFAGAGQCRSTGPQTRGK
jgi:hypothetical protein